MLKQTSLILLCAMPMLANAASCKDFRTQAAAQSWYEQAKKAGKTGWKNLDRDRDGRACDCNIGGNGKNCPNHKKK